MPRSKKEKMVYCPPLFAAFKPVNVMRNSLQRLPLSLDEYEAIRLADYLGLAHAEAAQEMEVSRSTFSRLIERARKKMAQFLVDGKELFIEGGNIHFRGNIIRCQDCGHMFKINIGVTFSECPECSSSNLVSLAGGFGHGRCCEHRNNSEGGNYATRRRNRTRGKGSIDG